MHWLPNPPDGTPVALGFDGSDVSDWTCLRAETRDGFAFTPLWRGKPTLWDPSESGGRVPRAEVAAAVADLFARFDVSRMYCDPPGWRTEIEEWAGEHGPERVVEWPTYRPVQMHAALERFHADILEGRVSFDGCPDTYRHLSNAKVAHRRDGRYVLTKPDRDRKIDAAVTTVLAHEAAADSRVAGWDTNAGPSYFMLP